MSEFNLSFLDNNKTMQLDVGDGIVVTLPENATTGYQWALSSFTNEILALEGTEGISAAPGPPGAGGSGSVFRFRAKAQGHGNICLKLWRGFESDDAVFKYNVNCNVLPGP
jgi:inhibitor of cysteine peptidase